MSNVELIAWKTVLAVIDLEVRMAENSAKLAPSEENRAKRDAWLHAQQAVARKLARMHEDSLIEQVL